MSWWKEWIANKFTDDQSSEDRQEIRELITGKPADDQGSEDRQDASELITGKPTDEQNSEDRQEIRELIKGKPAGEQSSGDRQENRELITGKSARESSRELSQVAIELILGKPAPNPIPNFHLPEPIKAKVIIGGNKEVNAEVVWDSSMGLLHGLAGAPGAYENRSDDYKDFWNIGNNSMRTFMDIESKILIGRGLGLGSAPGYQLATGGIVARTAIKSAPLSPVYISSAEKNESKRQEKKQSTANSEGPSKAGTEIVDETVSKGWKLGDDIYKLTANGNAPSWSTVKERYWKNEALKSDVAEKYGAENVERMRNGFSPQRYNPDKGGMESMELSHEPIPKRDGGVELVPRWPQEHAEVDPFRHPGY